MKLVLVMEKYCVSDTFISWHSYFLYPLQMKAVAGMKMSYNLQQAIALSRRMIIRGFRQDETHSALCSHLFSMIRGNRQHRRAFLISLLSLFDDSSVSKLTNTNCNTSALLNEWGIQMLQQWEAPLEINFLSVTWFHCTTPFRRLDAV